MPEPLNYQGANYPWQRKPWQRLRELLEQGRLPHALLFAGPAGTGKGPLAAALVASWLCESPSDGRACGSCQSCHLLAAGSHPDFCFPQTSGKSQQLKVDEIRELVAFCSKTAQLGGRRAALLNPAASMNISAQNALLKTLEEPGEDTLLLLVADQPQLLLPTIKSRCQQHWFAAPDRARALTWLVEQGLDANSAEAALAAAGTPLAALRLGQSDWFCERVELVEQLLALAQGRTSLVVVQRRLAVLPQDTLLTCLANWCQQSLRAGFCGLAPQDAALNAMLTLAKQLGSRRLSLWHDSLQAARAGLARSANFNKELLLDRLLWQLTPQGGASSLDTKQQGSLL